MKELFYRGPLAVVSRLIPFLTISLVASYPALDFHTNRDLAASIFAPQAAVAAVRRSGTCERHIMNHYPGTWTFSASTEYGSVVMIPLSSKGASGRTPTGPRSKPRKDDTASIGPNQSWEIIYGYNFLGITSGTMSITDQNGVTHSFKYANVGWDCPSVKHSGGTGAVAVNDPANGDYSIDAIVWYGASLKKTHKGE